MATIYADARLVVTADWTDGELVIYGQDLGPATPGGKEYEYWLTVPKAQLHLVASDVGAATNDDEGSWINSSCTVNELTRWAKALG